MLEISNEKIDYKEINEKVHSLKTLTPPRNARRLAYILILLLLILIGILFLPWQQNISATGKVTALRPSDRPQVVQSTIAGRIKEWRIQEGQSVTKGDTLAIISEVKSDYFDPQLLKRLEEQVTAKREGMEANQGKVRALDQQISALQDAQKFSLEKARNKYEQARLKVISDSANLQAEQVQYGIAKSQFGRYDSLYRNDGLISKTDWEKRQLKLQNTYAKVVALQNKLLISKNKLINARIEFNSLIADYTGKIFKSQSEKNSTQAYVANSRGELSKLRNKYANIEIRNQQYYVLAPQNGFVVKALKSGVGEMIKSNEAIATVMPANPSIAVELMVPARDVPLIEKGRHVRLEFDGWPALQVSGWPSVSVGTFGGQVKVIDYIISKGGKYRLLVVPDPEQDGNWPKQLRAGSGVYGWVMLKDVPIWYEFWRKLNGFPPSLYEEPNDDLQDKGGKKKKKAKN
ncbi:HlyD family secretion protein [Microscilla marina]|uniref:RND efflux membrane fusion protein n=1 Tax=Microscilla marina ATCC 23134 TaxID=313606 RepID=A1ZS34_MICM2|nr:HlyD family efflux transporter periplasmic adaptor subunit [Microscilla marina]EAY26757.1 RND efflux membrane fusion protein [Microscilla marina ATCC 23134]